MSANLVKDLREMTGAGILECSKALKENGNDLQKAAIWLREHGIVKAAKKADRETHEGLIHAIIDGKHAAIIELNCETDFVARNHNFVALTHKVAKEVALHNSIDVKHALEIKVDGHSLSDFLLSQTAKIGEKIHFARCVTREIKADEHAAVYNHTNGKVSVLVVLKNAKDNHVAKDIAMHICAMKPKYISQKDVDATYVETEKQVLLNQLKNENSGKPEAIIQKIVEGRISKQLAEVCLTEQPFVKEPSKKVKDLLNGAEIVNFYLFELNVK